MNNLKITLTIPKGKHLLPNEYNEQLNSRKGQFVQVSQCKECDTIGGFHQYNWLTPCPTCGSRERPIEFSAIWDIEKSKYLIRKK